MGGATAQRAPQDQQAPLTRGRTPWRSGLVLHPLGAHGPFQPAKTCRKPGRLASPPHGSPALERPFPVAFMTEFYNTNLKTNKQKKTVVCLCLRRPKLLNVSPQIPSKAEIPTSPLACPKAPESCGGYVRVPMPVCSPRDRTEGPELQKSPKNR